MASIDDTYLSLLAEGRFCVQRSRSTGRYVWYPREFVPGTGETDLDWVDVSGRGRVYSTTTVRERPPAPGFNVSLIDLEEGPRIMSRVESVAPGAPLIGRDVKARIVEQDGAPLLVFDLVDPL